MAEVCGTDIDPQAVEAARDNAIRNDVEAQFWLPADMPEGTFSIVVANILANPLKLLAPALLGRVAAHGALVLSGVLARQADEVIAVYKPPIRRLYSRSGVKRTAGCAWLAAAPDVSYSTTICPKD